MFLSEVASVRVEVIAARDAFTSDLERYLTLQRIADALDRVCAVLQRLEAALPWRAGADIADTSAELEAAVAAAADVIDPTLLQRVAAVEPMFDEAVLRVVARTRSSRQAVEDDTARKRESRGGKVAGGGPRSDSHARTPTGLTPLPVAAPACFGASAPFSVAAGSRFVAQFVAYVEGEAEAARVLLAQTNPDARIVTDVRGDALAVGTVVEVGLSGADMTVEGQPRDIQRFVWTGRTTLLSFEVELAAGATSTVLRYDVLVDGIVLAKIRLPVQVSAQPSSEPRRSAEGRFAKTAFASYSSKDRERVIDRVAAIRIAAKVDVFLDCHDLNPGEAWEPSLARAIDGCDTFLLFWSDAAAESPWVQWEWKRALKQPGIEGMQFHPLENGVKPPRELAAIHLGDPYMDLRAAARLRRATAMRTQEKA